MSFEQRECHQTLAVVFYKKKLDPQHQNFAQKVREI